MTVNGRRKQFIIFWIMHSSIPNLVVRSIFQTERQELFFKISISDTGKGIAPERQAEIFTRFYREPEVHDKPGVGIGLYLARTIMELQKGYIEVQSEMGKGACFRLYFPVNES